MNAQNALIQGLETPERIIRPLRRTSQSGDLPLLSVALHSCYAGVLRPAPEISRQLVSFQASKEIAGFRWYRFKEAFSPSLIVHLLNRFSIQSGPILDPFAGIGTTMFAARREHIPSDGIELLPIGQAIIRARLLLESRSFRNLLPRLEYWLSKKPWNELESIWHLPEIRITAGAYTPETKKKIECYMTALQEEAEPAKQALRFALLSVLESISYTSKDGQYLRWDYRSGRIQGKKPFNKGVIKEFDTAIANKLGEIIDDLAVMHEKGELFGRKQLEVDARLFGGSCLDIMPQMEVESYTALITSPPYCNRYDYTRTYALELALLGADEAGIRQLRQNMLTCTVENREKDLMALNPKWAKPIDIAAKHELLSAILEYLEAEKQRGTLNNNGIPRMVRGYFYELACVIAEAQRVLKPGAYMIMVNDNVRYAGVSIPVDLILSSLAEQLGFQTVEIMVLPNGKGNSSQQMGAFGRETLRKCIYVWRRI